MADGDLSHAVTRSLSQYLIARQSQAAATMYDARLENLLGLVEAELSELYLAETFWRFRNNPANAVEIDTFRLHLAARLERSPEFREQLASALGGHLAGRSRGRWVLVAGAAVIAVLALVGGFGISRTLQDDPRGLPVSTSPPSPTEPTTTPRTTTTTAPSTTTTAVPSSTQSSPTLAAVPGDGGALPKGKPVYLTDLPRPNNDWAFEHGERDVQFTQYPNSLWFTLVTCDSGRKSGAQQFRLKNFSRVEVKAVGMDSTSDTNVAVRFEIFANDDNVNAIAAQVVGAGETKELKVDLPPNVFALTLRVAFDQAGGSPCRKAVAVWGAPYVIAAGR